jgi:hypothetical protein
MEPKFEVPTEKNANEKRVRVSQEKIDEVKKTFAKTISENKELWGKNYNMQSNSPMAQHGSTCSILSSTRGWHVLDVGEVAAGSDCRHFLAFLFVFPSFAVLVVLSR